MPGFAGARVEEGDGVAQVMTVALSSFSHPQRGLACLSIRYVAGPSDDETEAMTIGGAVVHDGPIHLAE